MTFDEKQPWKRINCSKTNLFIDLKHFDFSYLSKTKILVIILVTFLPPTSFLLCLLKKEEIEKVVVQPSFQNMIFSSHKMTLHVKYEICIFKIKQVMASFVSSMYCEISILQNFEILKSSSNFEISVQITCDHNCYRFQNTFL